MDAIEFIKASREICWANSCETCPLCENHVFTYECMIQPNYDGLRTPEEILQIVKEEA